MSLSGLAFLLVYFGGAIAALARGPIYGLGIYVFTFYAHPPARWWRSDIPELRWALIASLVVFASVLIHKKKLFVPDRVSWNASPIVTILILYTLWMWIQVAWAISPDDHFYGVTLYTKFIVLIALIYTILNDENKLQWFALAHVLGCFYLGWLAWEDGKAGEGVGGPGINTSNDLSVHLVTGVMFGVTFLFSKNKWIKLVALCALPFILNGVILTGSRGGFLALVAAGIALYILSPASRKGQMKVYAILGLLLFSMLAGEKFLERMDTIFIDETEERDNSASSRFYIAEAQWEIFKSNIMGTGHRGTKTLSYNYLDPKFLSNGARSSHCLYMTVLVDQGVIGVILYLFLIIAAAKLTLRLKRKLSAMNNEGLSLLNAAAGASLVAIAVQGLFSSLWRMEATFWCLAVLIVIASFVKADESGNTMVEHPQKQRSLVRK